MGNLVDLERPLATLLTMIEVDPNDSAFENPTKFIGPVYEEVEAQKLAKANNWTIKSDGKNGVELWLLHYQNVFLKLIRFVGY
tara:strand:+ start:13701 stop:13949 length:249 start_codon:yes stop_codon:yes gene_type:complete